jgi:hypothetical protein
MNHRQSENAQRDGAEYRGLAVGERSVVGTAPVAVVVTALEPFAEVVAVVVRRYVPAGVPEAAALEIQRALIICPFPTASVIQSRAVPLVISSVESLSEDIRSELVRLSIHAADVVAVILNHTDVAIAVVIVEVAIPVVGAARLCLPRSFGLLLLSLAVLLVAPLLILLCSSTLILLRRRTSLLSTLLFSAGLFATCLVVASSVVSTLLLSFSAAPAATLPRLRLRCRLLVLILVLVLLLVLILTAALITPAALCLCRRRHE